MSTFLAAITCFLFVSQIGFESKAQADTVPTFAATSVTQEFNSSEETWSISGWSFSFGDSTTYAMSPIFTLDAGATYNTGFVLAAFPPNQTQGVPGTIAVGGVTQTANFVGEAMTNSGLYTVPLLPPGASQVILVPASATGQFSVDSPNHIANISIDLPGVMIFTFVPSANPGETEMVGAEFTTVPEPASVALSLVGLMIVVCMLLRAEVTSPVLPRRVRS
jgi:hypothetical protein